MSDHTLMSQPYIACSTFSPRSGCITVNHVLGCTIQDGRGAIHQLATSNSHTNHLSDPANSDPNLAP